MVSLQSVMPDQMGKYQTKWQKCDTDKIYLGDTYMNLSKTKTKRELYEKKLNPHPKKENQRHAAGGDPQSRPEADENMQGD